MSDQTRSHTVSTPQCPDCPGCRNPLNRVYRSRSSMLNDDQFDAIRAGDWYCTTCPTNGRGNTPYRYFWDHELVTDELVSKQP